MCSSDLAEARFPVGESDGGAGQAEHEFRDAHTECTGRQKMAALVDEHEEPERYGRVYDHKENVHRQFLRTTAVPGPKRIHGAARHPFRAVLVFASIIRERTGKSESSPNGWQITTSADSGAFGLSPEKLTCKAEKRNFVTWENSARSAGFPKLCTLMINEVFSTID